MVTRVAFVAQPVRDLDAAKRFYAAIPGLSAGIEMPGCWAEFDTPEGVSIGLDTFTPKAAPDATTYLALESDDIEADVAHLASQGGTIARPVWDNADGQGNVVCRMALVLDPEGNALMLHQMGPGRKDCC